MKFNKLTAAVLAGLLALGASTATQAVSINPDGVGQVLLYPYYTTNAGNTTVMSVVNTTEEAKAVKVRFLEGQNSREVLDFNLYLSAYDVWAAAIVNIDSVPTLVVKDTSCTVPSLYDNNKGLQPFLPWAMDDKDPEGFDDISRGSEGHMEIIEMGTMIDDVVTASDGTTFLNTGSALAVTHVDGVPADCAQLTAAWTKGTTNGYWVEDNFADMSAPSGGLFGGAAIVNVQAGSLYSYDAKAINGFADRLDAADDMHQEPGTILPSLDSGNILEGTVFTSDGQAYTQTFGRGVDALSFVLMKDAIMNEYTTEAVVAAETEWVITFPTKQFYVHQAFLNEYAAFRGTTAPTVPLAPFTSTWTWTAEVLNEDGTVKTAAYTDYACEAVKFEHWNREEETLEIIEGETPPLVSPRPPGEVVEPEVFELCFETQILQFGADAAETTSLLGSSNFYTVDNQYDTGWAKIDLDSETKLGELAGLPVTGFSVNRFTNGYLPSIHGQDVLSSYGALFKHKSSRRLSSF